MTKELTIAIASRNEIPMLMMTVWSAVEALKAAGIDGEVLVVENSDGGFYVAARDAMQGAVKDGWLRVIREPEVSIALATDRAHREADGEFVFYTDAHSLIGVGTLEAMLKFHRDHAADPIGFVHAPIQWAHQSAESRRTHFSLKRTKMGAWAAQTICEQRIPWKGMPHMIRRDVYEAIGGLGCCAKHCLGWGILRYLGIKPWLLGYENWAIPEGVVYHFGQWPKSAMPFTQYRTYTASGLGRHGTAYAVAAYVMGGEDFLRSEYELANMKRFLPSVGYAVEEAKRFGWKDRQWILENQTISLQDLLADPPWTEEEEATDLESFDEPEPMAEKVEPFQCEPIMVCGGAA